MKAGTNRTSARKLAPPGAARLVARARHVKLSDSSTREKSAMLVQTSVAVPTPPSALKLVLRTSSSFSAAPARGAPASPGYCAPAAPRGSRETRRRSRWRRRRRAAARSRAASRAPVRKRADRRSPDRPQRVRGDAEAAEREPLRSARVRGSPGPERPERRKPRMRRMRRIERSRLRRDRGAGQSPGGGAHCAAIAALGQRRTASEDPNGPPSRSELSAADGNCAAFSLSLSLSVAR